VLDRWGVSRPPGSFLRACRAGKLSGERRGPIPEGLEMSWVFGGKGETTMSLPNALLLLLLLPGLKKSLGVQVGSKDTTTMPVKVKGTEWGIRITMSLTDDEERQLSDISGAVIVYHAGGTRKGGFNEKPHYHVYIQHDGTRDDISAKLLSNPVIAKYHKPSNAFWMIDTKSTYTLESYWHYVWAGFPLKRQRLIHWGDSRPQLEIPESPLVSALVAPGPLDEHRGSLRPTTVSPKKTTLDKQNKFLQFCRDYYDGEDTNNVEPKEILGLLYDYCRQNGHTTESCCFTYVNYAIANLHTDVVAYEASKRQWTRRLLDKFF